MRLEVTSASEPPPAPSDDRLKRAITAHYELVWRMLRRLGVNDGAVEDAAQQVLIVFAKRLAEVQPGAERAFLIATATRVAADFRKKKARAREELDPETLAAVPSAALPPDELLDHRRARVLLDFVLAEMPDELRTIFVLFELEDLTMATIAELLQLPAGTVASRLRRARASFEQAAAQYSQMGNRP